MSHQEKDIQCCVKQCDKPLDQAYWNERWQNQETGWDMGQASPPITDYMAQYPNKAARILIPGCGNAYEAEFLVNNGFTNITLIDIAPKAVEALKAKFAEHAQVRVLCENFFEHQGQYDLIIEQTFFCAFPPAKRSAYAQKAAALLSDNGKVIGLLFNRQFHQPHPPFGGDTAEYKSVFEPHFSVKTMEECYNSIPPRAKSEVFINLVKK